MAAAKKTQKALRITTKRDGWRRAGRVWAGTTEVLAADFTKDQRALLENDPTMVVEEIDIAVEQVAD